MKEMIPKEKTIVIVTNEGYVKRTSPKSYTTNSNDQMALKPGDYIRNIYEVNTRNNLLLFTNLGNYLFVPIHIINETKWKDLGKHINNIIMMSQDEKIIGSLILDNPKSDITITTKKGMIKRVLLKELEVQRYSKPIMNIKLKDNDEVVSVNLTKKKKILLLLIMVII